MSRSRDTVSVYVVDDHALVISSLVQLIDRTPGFRVVGSSTIVATAVEEITLLRPRVAVVDGDIAGFDGLDVVRELGSVAPDVACVMLTAGVGLHWGRAEAVEAGAFGVVFKQLVDFPLLETIAAAAADQPRRA